MRSMAFSCDLDHARQCSLPLNPSIPMSTCPHRTDRRHNNKIISETAELAASVWCTPRVAVGGAGRGGRGTDGPR